MVKVDDAVSVDPSLKYQQGNTEEISCFPLILVEMKFHHTKNKGDLGVLKAQADLCAKGFLVCIPLSEHAPFDLIAYKNGVFKRIQVKARTIKQGKLNVRFEHSYSDRNGVHTKKVDMNSVDVFCVYCLDNDTCYYFNSVDVYKNIHISLRVDTPKNNQSRNIRWADDYREVP